MLELKNISFSFGDSQILKNVNLTVADKSFHTLIGVSGAGKTLILKLISGLQSIQQGSISNSSLLLSYVFQNAELLPWLTVEKNLEICFPGGIQEIANSLKKFRLEHTSKMYPYQLSGGTLKKVALLRAFLRKADLILMDEPFTHLDLAQKEEIYSFTHELWHQFNSTIILVTHDLDEAIYLSTDISYLSKKNQTILENYKIDFDRSASFNESKINSAHSNYYGHIYNRLKGEFR